jgi:hypothetical protein
MTAGNYHCDPFERLDTASNAAYGFAVEGICCLVGFGEQQIPRSAKSNFAEAHCAQSERGMTVSRVFNASSRGRK